MVNQNRREKLAMVADSGAVDHVCSKKELQVMPIEPTAASKAGMCYRGASGNKIANFGLRRMNGVTSNGTPAKMEIQVADVRRGLSSIPEMVVENNDVVCSHGAVTPMRRATGVMKFDLWVARPKIGSQFAVLAEVDEDQVPASVDKGESDSAFGRLVTMI